MRRIDLAPITLEGWSRLDNRQRQPFAEMFLRAAVRLGGPELRRWLRWRVRTAPTRRSRRSGGLAISDGDMGLLKSQFKLPSISLRVLRQLRRAKRSQQTYWISGW